MKTEQNTKQKWHVCENCGSHYKNNCDCGKNTEALNRLLKRARTYRMEKFKESERSISRALHIPYSGFGNPDYVDINDYFMHDLYSVLLECYENNEEGINSIEDFKEAWEQYDDNSSIHYFVESSLTWQQGLSESDIIINHLYEYEETDTGLWDGLQPEEAITAKAFWTYKNGLVVGAFELLEELQDEEYRGANET